MQRRSLSPTYSGMTSRTATIIAAERKASSREKQSQRTTLLPAAELVNNILDEELAKVAEELLNVVDGNTSQEDVKSIVIGLKSSRARLMSVRNRINLVLRVRQEDEPTEE